MLLLTATNILPERNASFTWIACRCLLPLPIPRMICGAEFGNVMCAHMEFFSCENPLKNLTFQTVGCVHMKL
jgi:hypothetical protein